jgi:hypothetical protein
MDSPPIERNGKTEPSVAQPSETPLILFCTIHKGADGKPLPFMHMGDRVAHKKVDGVWIEYEEPIYECVKCVFPEDEDGKI